MLIAPFEKDRDYDVMFEHAIKGISTSIGGDDDCLVICAGDPGTGKTRLMFHAYTIYAGDTASIDYVALTQSDFSEVIDKASKTSDKRFAGYDEANVTRREALTRWNRKLIDLYMNIRGLNIFHWWNNPSIEMLDKPFVEERVKGLIFIFTKRKDMPRLYYYFTQQGLLDLLEDKGNLKKRTLIKYGPQYAYYLGWFRDYKGPLLPAYQALKKDRMQEKVALFREEFSKDAGKMRLMAYCKHANIDHKVAGKIFRYGVESALLKEGEHYTLTGVGERIFSSKGVEEMDRILQNDLYKSKRAFTRRTVRPGLVNSIYQPGGAEVN